MEQSPIVAAPRANGRAAKNRERHVGNHAGGDLHDQLRSVRDALRAARQGDFSVRLPTDASEPGLMAEVALAFNALVEHNEALVREIHRVSQIAGRDGQLGERASLGPAAGAWQVAMASVNQLIESAAYPVTEATRILGLVVDGDLTQDMPVHLPYAQAGGRAPAGEFLRLGTTVNAVLQRLRSVSTGVSQVAREIGTEGKLGSQARIEGLSGTWKGLVDDVNSLANNLTAQVRNITLVSTAIANGDLSRKITVEAKGEILELKNTINALVDRLQTFAAEVTRVAREVGTEGKLGGQADVKGVSGTWRDLTDNVNMLAGNLTNQVRNIALVATAVANGDLSRKITVEVKGEILELKNIINAMVDQLRTFVREVTRVAREVGTEGKLGGQAQVPGVAGTWQELTESVNVMASNLTNQVRGIAKVVTAVANGDLRQRLVLEARGEIAALADTINNMTQTLLTFADQVTAVAREVGNEGKLGGQARVPGAAGTWKDLTESVNMFAGNLTAQVRNIALVATAIANGDLSKMITVEAKGEVLELKDTINAMVEQLRTFASEVTRVAREVGTEGQLGGQARVPGVSGTWKDLTDNVNLMASNLTDQVRGIGKVVTAVAGGDLNKKLVLVAKGEIATLADTINNMTETLRTFADQVTTVAREVGSEGKLGGQAKVPGAAGTWRDLTDNVNQLAANLTSQVRAIFDVATAVIQGDLTRSITVGARGEVLGLKDTINQMIANLRDTTRTNKEQDWLKTNLAKFFGIMQGQRSLQALTDQTMSELTPLVGGQHGAFYIAEREGESTVLKLTSTYAYTKRKYISNRFALGEGLVGQCALERKPITVTQLPANYVQIASGLGEAPPRSIAVFPVFFEDELRGVIEIGSFQDFASIQLTFLEQLMLNLGLAINLIGTSMRTEQLLQQLQGSNVELERRRKELEDKAQEIGKVSQYKSQFLTNMSHEIRTPLNSMMILAQMLAANEDGNLSGKQREWADTIHSSGRDLLALINQILDLSKVEAGRIETHPQPYPLEALREFAERTFRPVAMQRGLDFSVVLSPAAPSVVTTDNQLLQQILKNLLANAFKFTEHGKIELHIDRATGGIAFHNESLRRAPVVAAFAVSDTGIGISTEQRERIFEAFQQADSTITRKYGGTGLGLTISREYARVLGGEIVLESTAAVGSTFTLYLPVESEEARAPAFPAAPPREALLASLPAPAIPIEEAEVLSGRKILVVEDEPRNLYATTALLERHAVTVLPASSAREAYAALERHPDVALVLMDIMMPDIDGYQATRQIRSMREFAHLPIVALTAKASESDRAQCMAAGCDDYLVKPTETRQLVSIIARHLRQ